MAQCVPSTSVPISTEKRKVGDDGKNSDDKTNSAQSTSQYTLVGRSRAGDGTCFVIPQLSWMFDCGSLVETRRPTALFLTHTHADHIAHLTHWTHPHLAQGKSTPLPIYMPQRVVPVVQRYLDSFEALVNLDQDDDDDDDDEYDEEGACKNDDKNKDKTNPNLQQKPMPYQLIGVTPGQEVLLHQKGKQFRIRIVECVHRIDCVGYDIWYERQTLLQQYKKLSGPEIGSLKRQGVVITTAVWTPLLCYLGDTTAGVFHNNHLLLEQHNTIVVECSFLEDRDQEPAARTMHMHWKHLQPLIDGNPTTLFVLTHVSLKYAALFVRRFFNEHNRRTGNDNIHPMIVQDEVEQQWYKKHQKTGTATTRTAINTNHKESPGHGDEAPPTCNCFVCQPATTTSPETEGQTTHAHL